MDKYCKTDHEGLIKDRTNGAILSVDQEKLAAYKKKKRYMAETTGQSERIERIEHEVAEIKDMFKLILEKLENK